MKKFIEDIVFYGAEMEWTEFKDSGDSHDITRSKIAPNNGKYMTLPENVKRCYYLNANEKLVLFELYSWASEDGKSKIAMDLVSLKLGITERTVRKCVKELANKKFVQISKQGKSNVYKFDNLKENPYLVLSEFVHEFIDRYYYKKGLRQYEDWLQRVGDEGFRLWREALVDTLAKEAKKERFYEPYLERLNETPEDYENIHISFVDELLEFVNETAIKRATKQGLVLEAI